jgi:hypothetical protein
VPFRRNTPSSLSSETARVASAAVASRGRVWVRRQGDEQEYGVAPVALITTSAVTGAGEAQLLESIAEALRSSDEAA